MKGHTTLMSRASDEWATPRDLFDRLDAVHHFDLDAAATAANTLVASWFGQGGVVSNALTVAWADYGTRIWCNPPYSKLRLFVEAAYQAGESGARVVMLIPARTDTRAFQDWIWNQEQGRCYDGVAVNFLPGRLKFGGATNGAPFPSCLVYFGVTP